MYQSGLVEQGQTVQELLCKYTNKRCAEPSELVLFDQLVQINAEQFENKTKMLSVDEGILQTQNVVIIVLVKFCIELSPSVAFTEN
jgi:hypothetical protein